MCDAWLPAERVQGVGVGGGEARVQGEEVVGGGRQGAEQAPADQQVEVQARRVLHTTAAGLALGSAAASLAPG